MFCFLTILEKFVGLYVLQIFCTELGQVHKNSIKRLKERFIGDKCTFQLLDFLAKRYVIFHLLLSLADLLLQTSLLDFLFLAFDKFFNIPVLLHKLSCLIFHQVGKFFKAFYCIILNFLIFFQEYKIIIAVDAELLDFFIKLDNFFIGWIAKQVVDQSEYHVARVDAVFYLINAFYLLSELLFQVFELLDA